MLTRFLLVNCWKNYQQNANFGSFWASERSAASGLNTGFARHRSPASRADTGFGAKHENKKSRKSLNLRLLKWRDGLCAELDCALLALRVFAPQKSPSSLVTSCHKKRNPFGLRFLKWRDGLCAELDCALLALRVFAPQKSPSSLVTSCHKKTQPFRIAFLKVAGWTRCRRSCVSILITRIYFR